MTLVHGAPTIDDVSAYVSARSSPMGSPPVAKILEGMVALGMAVHPPEFAVATDVHELIHT